MILRGSSSRPTVRRGRTWISVFLLLQAVVIPAGAMGQEVNMEGWSIPDLKGLVPYSIQVSKIDGVEKIVEKFLTAN